MELLIYVLLDLMDKPVYMDQELEVIFILMLNNRFLLDVDALAQVAGKGPTVKPHQPVFLLQIYIIQILT